jgi:hypothetical protein
MNEDKKLGRVLKFAVGGALLVAPLAVGCGGGSANSEEPEHTVNEPVHVNEVPPEESTGDEAMPPEEGNSETGDPVP